MNKPTTLSLIALSMLTSACTTSPSHIGASRPSSFVTPGPELDSSSSITTFSQVRLDGVDASGLIGVMPTVGEISMNPADYRSSFNPTNSVNTPGSYSVQLDDSNIRTDITTTDHVSLYRFIFPDSKECHVRIDVSQLLPSFQGGEVHVLDDKSIQGIAKHETEDGEIIDVSFFARFSKFSKRRGTWSDDISDKRNRVKIDEPGPLGAFAYFWMNEGESLLMKVGISTVSIEDARKNIQSEFPGWDFDDVQLESEQSWK